MHVGYWPQAMVGEAGKRQVILLPLQSLPMRTRHSHITGFAGKRTRERQHESKNMRPRRGKSGPTGGWGDGHPPTARGRPAAPLQAGGSGQHQGEGTSGNAAARVRAYGHRSPVSHCTLKWLELLSPNSCCSYLTDKDCRQNAAGCCLCAVAFLNNKLV